MTRSFGKGGRETYFKYELTNVQITSFQFNASGNDEAVATESVSVAFEKIEWTYTEFDETGKDGGKVEAGWDIEKGDKL